MEYFQTQNMKNNPQNKVKNNYNLYNKGRLTEDQVRVLEKSFTTNKKLEPHQKSHLANQLGVPPRQIAIWYQNKRARWKSQVLEIDNTTLQVKLENALSDKKKLEKDVHNLQQELRKTQEMHFSTVNYYSTYNYQKAPEFVTTTSNDVTVCSNFDGHEEVVVVGGGGGGGGGSLCQDQDNVVLSNEGLEIDELYACFYGSSHFNNLVHHGLD